MDYPSPNAKCRMNSSQEEELSRSIAEVGEMAEALDLSFQDALESQTWTREFADSII